MTENEKKISSLCERMSVVETETRKNKEDIVVVFNKLDKILYWLLGSAAALIISNVGIIVALLMGGN